ncbi:MAG: SRPBCC family protein [Caulobacteraceae bacterium]
MTQLTLVRRIAARPSIVFEALTTAEGIAAWWGPDDLPVTLAEIDARVGGAFRVRFHTLDGREHESSGECLAIDPPHRLVMSWRWSVGGQPEEAGRTSRIEFNVTPTADGVELTLIHSGLKDAVSELGHQRGWAGALDKLIRHLGGVPT